MLLGTLAASVLVSTLTGKGVIRTSDGTIRAGEKVLMLPYPLTNFEIQKYNKNEPKFNGFYSRNNLPKVKDGDNYNKSWWVWINRNSRDWFVCKY